MVVMSARDLGLSSKGTYLKPHWAKGKPSKFRKTWEFPIFKEPAFRVPYQLARNTRGKGTGRPVSWLDAAIDAGLVETVLSHEASQGGPFLSPLDGKELPQVTREEVQRLLREGMEQTLKEFKND